MLPCRLVRERPASPDLYQQPLVVQARPGLRLDLLKLQLGTQAHLVVVIRLVSAVVDVRIRREIIRRHVVAGEEGVSQGERFPGLRIYDQEFFLNAECTHTNILRQERGIGTVARRS